MLMATKLGERACVQMGVPRGRCTCDCATPFKCILHFGEDIIMRERTATEDIGRLQQLLQMAG